MAKVASILFLIVFGWYSIGFIMHTRLQVRAVKREMRRNIKKGGFLPNDVVTMVLQAADFADPMQAPRLVNDHEFRWNGLMYDVVSVSWKNNSLVVCCLPDARENQLLSWFVHFMKDKSGSSKKFNSNTAFSFGHFAIARGMAVPAFPHHDIAGWYGSYSAKVITTGLDVPVPPPWCQG